jgi:hypothetical protein
VVFGRHSGWEEGSPEPWLLLAFAGKKAGEGVKKNLTKFSVSKCCSQEVNIT